MSYHSNVVVNTEDRERYRQHVARLDVPTMEVDTMIDIVHSILSYFVDQAFEVQSDQITLQSVRKSFNAALAHATIEHQPENQTDDAQSNGVDRNPTG